MGKSKKKWSLCVGLGLDPGIVKAGRIFILMMIIIVNVDVLSLCSRNCLSQFSHKNHTILNGGLLNSRDTRTLNWELWD